MTYSTERPLIRAAIEKLNWNYGWGRVTQIRRFMDGRIEVDVEDRYRKGRTYLARTVGRNSVRFRGHQISYRGDDE